MTLRTQKKLIEDVQQSEKVGEAIAELVLAKDRGETGLRQQAILLTILDSEFHFLKNEVLAIGEEDCA